MTKKFYFATLIAAIATVILCCALEPLYISLVSDIVYASGILPVIVGIVIDIFEYAITALLLATACASVYIETVDIAPAPKIAKYLHFVILSVPVLKGILSVIVTLIMSGEITWEDIRATLLTVIVDILIHILAVFICRHFSVQHIKRRLAVKKASATLNIPYTGDHDGAYPFKKFIDFKNPTLSGLVWACIAILGTLVISRLIYDINIGAPESVDELIEIPLGYLEDVFWAFLTYTGCFFIAGKFIKKSIELEENNINE